MHATNNINQITSIYKIVIQTQVKNSKHNLNTCNYNLTVR